MQGAIAGTLSQIPGAPCAINQRLQQPVRIVICESWLESLIIHLSRAFPKGNTLLRDFFFLSSQEKQLFHYLITSSDSTCPWEGLCPAEHSEFLWKANEALCVKIFLIYSKILVLSYPLLIGASTSYYLCLDLHVKRWLIRICIFYNFRTCCLLCVGIPFPTDHHWVSESNPRFRWDSLFFKL